MFETVSVVLNPPEPAAAPPDMVGHILLIMPSTMFVVATVALSITTDVFAAAERAASGLFLDDRRKNVQDVFLNRS